MVGATISRYRVLARLGSGGMGEVYHAEDLRLHRPVALKVIRHDAVGAPAADRLLAEARAASALNHPNIAVIYEVDEADVPLEAIVDAGGPAHVGDAAAAAAGAPGSAAALAAAAGRSAGVARVAFIAMEYVAGRTLQDLAARGELTGPAALDATRQVAHALAEAHDHGLVHRDIKPSNVMMTETGLIKVLDFGVAYRMVATPPAADDSTRTDDFLTTRGFVGTLPYVAPEQATGRDIDGRADMFSLGVMLYELLTGQRPFQGETPLQTFEALLKDDPPPLPPSTRGGDDPKRQARIEGIIHRMLAKDRAHRYANLRDVIAALDTIDRVVNGDADARARDGGTAPDAAADGGQSLAVASFVNITGNPEDEWLGTGISETLTADLSRIGSVAVVARERVHELLRTLAERFPERGASLFLRAGRELGVRWILSGGFQRTGDAVRVTASLTDVATGRVVRTVKVDGGLGGIFALQDQVVSELGDALRLEAEAATATTIATATAAGPSKEETTLVEAYEAFSKGVINLRVESYESLDRAVMLFERAVRLDPSYARAHLELGSAYSTKADYLALPELRERALASYRRALELRPDSVRAWRGLGAALVSMGQQDDGMSAIRHALSLDPHDAGAHAAMARALFIGLGRFHEAAEAYDRALAENPKAGWYALQLAHCAALAREYARGEAAARQAIALQESFLSGGDGVIVVGAYMRQGHLASLQDRDEEAVEQFQQELDFLTRVDHALRGRIIVELNMRLGSSYLKLGSRQKAHMAFDLALEGFERRLRLGADDPFTRYYAACVHARRGDAETALAFLERAAAERPALTRARARVEPEFEALRGDARFIRFVESA